jgi:hypothetical protein
MNYYGKKYPEITEADRASLEEQLTGIDEVKLKLRYLNEIKEEETRAEREKHFNDAIKGRVFYIERDGIIELILPYECTDWSLYNSCKVKRISTRIAGKSYSNNDMISFVVNDTQRVDSFNTNLIEATPKKIEQFKQQLHKLVDGYLKTFEI